MKHVLVIRLSALGDVAIMAPLVEEYATANPDVTFTVAGPLLLEPLFESEPNVHFLGVDKKQSVCAIYRQLESAGADAVADLHQVNKVGWALLLMRLRHLLDFRFRIYHLHKGRLSRWLMLSHLSRKPRRPQYDRYEDVFNRMGLKCLTKDVETFWPVKATAGRVRIGVAPFAQHDNKIWPQECMERLVSMLAGRGFEVLLFGGKDEASVLEGWANRYHGVSSVAGKHSFREELLIIKGLTLMVSMDSANMHFASAVGTPVVSIWGATHPDFGFYGYRQDPANALCANMPCQPCSAYGQKKCRYGDRRCLRAITPEQVLEKIETLTEAAQ